ncbi:hypothetical protein G4H71_10700 [Rhodococcus triatomae]|uniref:Heavy-metal-associated domain-containing protein n=1 Tax=Rhodococcus triatomae TaxID=300028 RepID=A0A1G8QKW0_9NOCA|nr:hypothetical protein [Rhodococcus triatomae]QNG20644.1 hypothetical protein G4H72_19680 [Rhodococcus triatomae]QNG23438.1 hypothetical protein G4H71_10700 [Rhodococcus triatomae]SDJ05243.1 hypothetical protein SAMN05444695_11565 [Rhodococcus triatomae]
MNTPTKLAAFAVGLAVLFAAGFGVGAAFGPGPVEPVAHGGDHDTDREGTARPDTGASEAGGLTATDGDHTLVLDDPVVSAGQATDLRFRILTSEGVPLTRYTTSHEKDLHLIVVRRDLTGYRHLHPVLDDTGTWSTPLEALRGGDYRVYADFTPGDGAATTLGADLHVAGDYDPRSLPAAAASTSVDGYDIALDGTARAGRTSELTFTITRDGAPVTDLEPHLGAYGHLVALRADDLGYLHVHPAGHPGDGSTDPGPDIGFGVTVPGAGNYRLFLDFRHEGVVRTAEFTLTAEGTVAAETPSDTESDTDGHGH